MCENPNQENIKVAVRIRPLSKIEEANGSKQIEYTIDGNIIYLKDYGFGFDYFFEPNIDQETLYQSTIQENMLPKLFQGYNVTVFVFGQTGSGMKWFIFFIKIFSKYSKKKNCKITFPKYL